MIVALDVCYKEGGLALVGAVAFESYASEKPCAQWTVEVSGVLDYEPGSFHARELPCLIAALKASPVRVDAVVVDAYVDLDEAGRPGLGRRLWDALGQTTPVVGVAKTRFEGIPKAWELTRGESIRPLYVTAAGLSQEEALESVASMHGKHRLPTMLSLVDALGRGRPGPGEPGPKTGKAKGPGA